MATTFFNPTDPSTNLLWSKELYRETRKKTVATKFIGATSDALIQILDDTRSIRATRSPTPCGCSSVGRGYRVLAYWRATRRR